MGISASLVLGAAGAILIWAVNATVQGMNIHTIGVILLVVAAIGFVTSLFFWSSWGGFGARGPATTAAPPVAPTAPAAPVEKR